MLWYPGRIATCCAVTAAALYMYIISQPTGQTAEAWVEKTMHSIERHQHNLEITFTDCGCWTSSLYDAKRVL